MKGDLMGITGMYMEFMDRNVTSTILLNIRTFLPLLLCIYELPENPYVLQL